MEKQRCASCFTNENLDEVKDVSTTENVTGRVPNAKAYVDSQVNLGNMHVVLEENIELNVGGHNFQKD